jgi:hypothetical protein
VADDKIVIEIELDDGKIVKGLAKLETGAKKTGKEVEGIGNQIEKAFGGTAIGNAADGLNGFVARIRSIHPALLIASAAVASLGVAFERALEGEKINALNTQFQILGQQAGVSTELLRANLQAATGGAVDFEDVLKSTNKFLVEFGQNANKLPEVLDLARKATSLFGGEVTQNFEQIAQAAVSGQTRSLKSLGIIIDQEEAYRKFAESIGVAAGALNDAGKKQAVLNAILEQGGETFKNVDPNINQLSTSVDKLKVQLGDLFDDAATRSTETFGGIFASALNTTTSLLERLNLATKTPQTGLAGLEDNIRSTELKLGDLAKQIQYTVDEIERNKLAGNGLASTFNLGDLTSQRDRLEKDLERMTQRFQSFQASANADAQKGAEERANFIDQEKLAANLASLQQQVLTAKSARLAAEAQLDLSEDERVALRNEQIALSVEMQNLKIAEITRLYREQGLLDEQAFEDLKTEIMAKGNAERERLQNESAIKMRVASILSAQAINQGVSNAIQATVLAVKNGQNALKAFGSSILGFIGDVMIQIGTSVLGIGEAMEAIRASIAGMTGGPAIFAGIALIALGTLLKSLSGKGGGAMAGGGIGSGTAGSSSLSSEAPDIENRRVGSQIAVNIQGDVLDSQDTGLRIVDILRTFADKNGDVVTA